LSSPPQNPAASDPPASPAVAASDPKPASPATTATTAERPDGIPDSYWDAEAKALKVDPVALAKDLKERDELKTFKAAEDVKALSRPQKPDDYKIELPPDFKPPAGVEFKFDMADPLLAQARAEAHAQGMSQAGFSKMLGLYAAAKVGEEAQIEAARTAEQAKLGANAGARVDAVLNFLKGADPTPDKRDAAALAAGLVTARQVEAWERLITRITSQGAASFSQQHRVPPDNNEIPGFATMSFAQQRHAQEQLRARKTA
jgi:hypothetical protein